VRIWNRPVDAITPRQGLWQFKVEHFSLMSLFSFYPIFVREFKSLKKRIGFTGFSARRAWWGRACPACKSAKTPYPALSSLTGRGGTALGLHLEHVSVLPMAIPVMLKMGCHIDKICLL
jgi:hypothetical protein